MELLLQIKLAHTWKTPKIFWFQNVNGILAMTSRVFSFGAHFIDFIPNRWTVVIILFGRRGQNIIIGHFKSKEHLEKKKIYKKNCNDR